MVLGWILLALAVGLAATLVVLFLQALVVESRLAPKRPRPQLPWSLRRFNPVVPKAYRCAELARPHARAATSH